MSPVSICINLVFARGTAKEKEKLASDMQTDENLYSCFNLTFLYIIIFFQRNERVFPLTFRIKEKLIIILLMI